jgi:hypothetical protein
LNINFLDLRFATNVKFPGQAQPRGGLPLVLHEQRHRLTASNSASATAGVILKMKYFY